MQKTPTSQRSRGSGVRRSRTRMAENWDTSFALDLQTSTCISTKLI